MKWEEIMSLVSALGKLIRMAGIRDDEPMWSEEDYQYAKKVYEEWRFLEVK